MGWSRRNRNNLRKRIELAYVQAEAEEKLRNNRIYDKKITAGEEKSTRAEEKVEIQGSL
jgi:hypothetical protein